MKKRSTFVISLVLILSIVASLLVAIPATAAEDGAAATAVIEIGNAADLKKIGVDANYPLNGNYKLTADIDISGSEWTPIGDFAGTFDGNGKTISGMTFTQATDAGSAVGLFKVVNGIVKNLKLTNVNIALPGSVKDVGVVAHQIGNTATISACETSGTITMTSAACGARMRWGGITSYAGSDSVIEYCKSNVTITATANAAAGNYKNACYVAGIVAQSLGNVKYCVNNGDITVTAESGEAYAGGIAGTTVTWGGGTLLKVENCINNGKISATNGASGIVACVSKDKTATLNNNFNLGAITVGNGGKVGQIVACQNNATAPTANGNFGLEGGAVAGVGELAAEATLKAKAEYVDINTKVENALKGEIEEEGVIEIATAEDLKTKVTDMSAEYKLTADIDLGGVAWTPIGTYDDPFAGVFDGNGHTVSNFTITADKTYGQTSAGFISAISKGTVKNLRIANATITTSYSCNVGAIVGSLKSNDAGLVTGCVTASDVKVIANGAHNGDLKLGGIVGWSGHKVEYCENNATVTVEKSLKDGTDGSNKAYAGGVVGGAVGLVKNCVNNGAVTVADYEGKYGDFYTCAGGVVGEINPWGSVLTATVEGCINNATVKNVCANTELSIAAGGIVGQTYGSNNLMEARIIKNCYNFGALECMTVGQIVGYRGLVVLGNPQYGLFTSEGNVGITNLAYMVGNAETFNIGVSTDTADNMKAQENYKAIVKALDDNLIFAISEMPAPAVPTGPLPGTEETTTDDSETTVEPETTVAPETTNNPETTNAPETEEDTTATEKEGGCKSSASIAAIVVLSILGVGITACKKKN